MKKLKNLPIGIQSFEKLREEDNNFVYVDKTQHIYKIAHLNRPYFISRPRRFGKSLTCSTLKALFENKRKLFKGLWIDSSDWKWQEYSVVSLSFSGVSHESPDELKRSLSSEIKYLMRKNEILFTGEKDLKSLLKDFVRGLHEATGQRVVIIIDEYDKPIIDHINDIELAESNRKILCSFFETIKDLDDYIRFVFITGVSKFSKASVFSGLNNLDDLTNNENGSLLMGYTQNELLENFSDHIDYFSEKRGKPREEIIEKLRKWYDGYCFNPRDLNDQNKHVYNPFSLLKSLSEQEFENYWFLTGTPRFLISLMKKRALAPIEIEIDDFSKSSLAAFDIEKIPLHTLLVQTGYLGFKSYDERREHFVLRYPNAEIQKSFLEHLAGLLTTDQYKLRGFVDDFKDALEDDNVDDFLFFFQQFLRNIPYNMYIKEEKYFQSLFYIVLKMIGAEVDVEHRTNNGRIDAVIRQNEKLYLIECKYGKDPQEALQQIKNKQYFAKFLHEKCEKVLIGLNFDIKTKEVFSEWEIIS